MYIVCVFEKDNPEIEAPVLEDISAVETSPLDHFSAYVEGLSEESEDGVAIEDYDFFLIDEDVGAKLVDIEDDINGEDALSNIETRYTLYELLRRFQKE